MSHMGKTRKSRLVRAKSAHPPTADKRHSPRLGDLQQVKGAADHVAKPEQRRECLQVAYGQQKTRCFSFNQKSA